MIQVALFAAVILFEGLDSCPLEEIAGIWVKLSQLLLCKFRYWGFGFACFPHHGDGGLGFSCIALAKGRSPLESNKTNL